MATIVDKGLETMARLINGILGGSPTASYFNYIAIGTDATAESNTQTALISEETGDGMERQTATVSYVASNQTRWYCLFDPVSDAHTINECGIFDGATIGAGNSNMLLRHVFASPIVMAKTDLLDLTITVTMNR